MNRPVSLGLRLAAVAGLWVCFALIVTGLLLGALFRSHVLDQAQEALTQHLDELTARVEPGADGQLRLSDDLADPRFRRPYSGLYWQAEDAAGHLLRSRSLWDQALTLPAEPGASGALLRDGIEVAALGRLIAVEREVRLPAPGRELVRLAVARSAAEIEQVTLRFDRILAISLSVLAVGLVVAVTLQVTVGLRPLAQLREQLGWIRAGSATRLEGSFPDEIRPLTEELNELLADNAAMLDRARNQASDLAHGLKTPLTIMQQEAEAIEATGLIEAATGIREQVARMRAHVDHQLARTRAEAHRHRPSGTIEVAPVIVGLIQVVDRLASPRGISFEPALDPGCRFRGAKADLEEMAGNLLDNGGKWAKGRVRISTAIAGDRLRLTVDDDGPGLPEAIREQAFTRGQRLDEHVPGTGLGLAIVRDLAELYGGSAVLGQSPLGGLRAELDLPGA